jgi:hypothetical protein
MEFIIINQRELAALSGLPYLQQLAYLHGIKPFVDYKTNLEQPLKLQNIQIFIENNELMEVITEKFKDLTIQGFIVEVSPIEAEMMGAFSENALSEEDAMEAIYD